MPCCIFHTRLSGVLHFHGQHSVLTPCTMCHGQLHVAYTPCLLLSDFTQGSTALHALINYETTMPLISALTIHT